MEHKTEYLNARITQAEKLALYRLANKQGGLSSAVRYLIQEYAMASKNDKSASTSQGEGALVSANN